VRRDGRQGVGASYSTREAGEPTRWDPVEGRGRRIADRLRGTMPGIPRSETISTQQQTIATRAQQAPEMSFTSLHHHIDLAWLDEAYRRTRKDGAPGIDGQTAAAYAEHLEVNLRTCSTAPSLDATERQPSNACTSRRAMARPLAQ